MEKTVERKAVERKAVERKKVEKKAVGSGAVKLMAGNVKVCIVVGTRPEIIKMAPLIRACEEHGLDHFILHTGQHYSYEMDRKFFEDLELAEPKYNLNVGSSEFRKQVGMMIREIGEVLIRERPDVVFVQGDTNTVLAAALSANKQHIKVGHHEAGLRSHDLTMLEETNRIITDHVSDFLFTPTESSRKNLLDEGISMGKIYLTGNTVVDAVFQHLEISRQKTDPLGRLGLMDKGYVLVTAHRAENVDAKNRLEGVLKGLELVAAHFGIPVLYPMHPRTRKRIADFGLRIPHNITVTEPVGYLEFLQLEAGAKLIITDSGGLQEEACILRVPCVTVRDNTERPETIDAGINVLAGTDPGTILKCAIRMSDYRGEWVNPFGDGTAGKKIIKAWLSAR